MLCSAIVNLSNASLPPAPRRRLRRHHRHHSNDLVPANLAHPPLHPTEDPWPLRLGRHPLHHRNDIRNPPIQLDRGTNQFWPGSAQRERCVRAPRTPGEARVGRDVLLPPCAGLQHAVCLLPDRARHEADRAGEDCVCDRSAHGRLYGDLLFRDWIPVSATDALGYAAADEVYQSRK